MLSFGATGNSGFACGFNRIVMMPELLQRQGVTRQSGAAEQGEWIKPCRTFFSDGGRKRNRLIRDLICLWIYNKTTGQLRGFLGSL